MDKIDINNCFIQFRFNQWYKRYTILKKQIATTIMRADNSIPKCNNNISEIILFILNKNL